MASNPARSSSGARPRIMAVVIRVAHRHWCASRSVTSMMRMVRWSGMRELRFHPSSVHGPTQKVGVIQEAPVKRQRGRKTFGGKVVECQPRTGDGIVPVAAVNNQLAKERVVG